MNDYALLLLLRNQKTSMIWFSCCQLHKEINLIRFVSFVCSIRLLVFFLFFLIIVRKNWCIIRETILRHVTRSRGNVAHRPSPLSLTGGSTKTYSTCETPPHLYLFHLFFFFHYSQFSLWKKNYQLFDVDAVHYWLTWRILSTNIAARAPKKSAKLGHW